MAAVAAAEAATATALAALLHELRAYSSSYASACLLAAGWLAAGDPRAFASAEREREACSREMRQPELAAWQFANERRPPGLSKRDEFVELGRRQVSAPNNETNRMQNN